MPQFSADQIRQFVLQNINNPAAISAAMSEYGLGVGDIQRAGGWSTEQMNEYMRSAQGQGVQFPHAAFGLAGGSGKQEGMDPNVQNMDAATMRAVQDRQWRDGQYIGDTTDYDKDGWSSSASWDSDTGGGPESGAQFSHGALTGYARKRDDGLYDSFDPTGRYMNTANDGNRMTAKDWATFAALVAGGYGLGTYAAGAGGATAVGAGGAGGATAGGTSSLDALLAGGGYGADAGTLIGSSTLTSGGVPALGTTLADAGIMSAAGGGATFGAGAFDALGTAGLEGANYGNEGNRLPTDHGTSLPDGQAPTTNQGVDPTNYGNEGSRLPTDHGTSLPDTPTTWDKFVNSASNWGSKLLDGDGRTIQQAITGLGLINSLFGSKTSGTPGTNGGGGSDSANLFGAYNGWTPQQQVQVDRFANRDSERKPWTPLAKYAEGGPVMGLEDEMGGGALGLIEGPGSGQSDSVNAQLSDGEYVFDAETVSALGDGSNAAGAKVLDELRQRIRAHKRSAPASKIPPPAKAPEQYMTGGQ